MMMKFEDHDQQQHCPIQQTEQQKAASSQTTVSHHLQVHLGLCLTKRVRKSCFCSDVVVFLSFCGMVHAMHA